MTATDSATCVGVLLPLAVFLVVLLPRQFLRRWWVWIVVMVAVTTLEGLGKFGVGRPRPEGMRLGFPSGQQVCASLGRVTKAKNGGLVVRSTARPRSTLRLKPRKDGRVSFSFEQKTGFELPNADPMTLSVGFFVGDTPYRGSAAVQAKGHAVAAH